MLREAAVNWWFRALWWAAVTAASVVLAIHGAFAQQLLPPAFASAPVVAADASTAYSYSIGVVDLDLLDTVVISAPTLPAWLTLTDHQDRTATLAGTPTPADVGAHSVVLEASDGVNSVQQTFTVTVSAAPINVAPLAVADSYSTAADTQLTVNAASGVLANDTDADGDALTAALVADVTHGTLALNATGAFVYAPSAGYSGADAFTYRASDGTAVSADTTVTLTVTAGNAAPAAVDDQYTVTATTLTVNAAAGVLANDTDANSDPLTAALGANVASGTLQLNVDGSFTYTPTPNFSGTDTFTYRANDGTANSAFATVTLAVSDTNDAPTAAADAYSVDEDGTLTVNAATGVLANDNDPEGAALTATLVTNVASGTLALAANGSFTYAPPAGFNGSATFTYRAGDGTLTSAVATVTITVAAVNDAPVAAADSYTTAEDTALTVNAATGVLANDSDPDGGALTAALVGAVANGALAFNANGSFTFTPAANFSGTTTFTYQAHDASTASATTVVTITIAPVNDSPFITSSPATTVAEGVTYSYTLTASDADANPLAFAATVLPAWLTFSAPATLSGVPQQADVGSHNVTLTVSDGIAAPVTQSFTIVVQAVDNAPLVAAIPDQVATEGVAFSLDLAQFVTDPDTAAAGIAYAIVGTPPAGLSLSAAGILAGVPTLATSVGDVTVRFTAADAGNSVPGALRLSVLRAGRTDLAIAVAATPNPVLINTPTTWTITVTNQSQVAVDGVAVDAVFAGEVPFRFDGPATAGCTPTTSGNDTRVQCALGALAGGASLPVTLTGSGGFAGDVFATAVVAVVGATPIDETPANDRATASLSVAQQLSARPAQSIGGLAARAAAAGDLNGDGFDDLAIVTGSSQGVIVLLNVVDPANANKRSLSTTPLVLGGEAVGNDIALADVDRDGDLDIVTAAGAGAPHRVFLNTGGTFASATLDNAASGSAAIAVGDVNGDQFVDLVFAGAGSSTVLMNRGSGGTFVRGASVGTGDARAAVLVDLFGDALPELVLANANGDAAVYRNTGGAFQLEVTLATGAATAVRAADFNGDGKIDLVFGRATVATAGLLPADLVYLNTSSTRGEFFVADELGAAATASLAIGDYDLDGDADILAVNADDQRIFSNVGAATGAFALHPQQLQSAAARMAVTGKFSVDGRLDVALIAGGGAAVFYNDGAGNLGVGDVTGPTIQLRGDAAVTLNVDDPYGDAGATATDALDGDVSARLKTDNPVNTALIGSYTVTYSATDLSGNSAPPVTRTVRVQARDAEGGGGGGALGLELLALLTTLLARRRFAASRKRG